MYGDIAHRQSRFKIDNDCTPTRHCPRPAIHFHPHHHTRSVNQQMCPRGSFKSRSVGQLRCISPVKPFFQLKSSSSRGAFLAARYPWLFVRCCNSSAFNSSRNTLASREPNTATNTFSLNARSADKQLQIPTSQCHRSLQRKLPHLFYYSYWWLDYGQ